MIMMMMMAAGELSRRSNGRRLSTIWISAARARRLYRPGGGFEKKETFYELLHQSERVSQGDETNSFFHIFRKFFKFNFLS